MLQLFDYGFVLYRPNSKNALLYINYQPIPLDKGFHGIYFSAT